MLDRVTKRVNTLIWGTESVSCAECGARVSPSKAVWHGGETYCSIEHDARDHEAVRWSAGPSTAVVSSTREAQIPDKTAPVLPHAA